MAEPEGLVYRPELISESDEQALVDELGRLEFHEIRMHGVVAKRTARHFGIDYDYGRRAIVREVDPIPDWLLPLRVTAASIADLPPEDLVEVLVQRYPEGAQIGWHRDAPMFGIVLGVSLLAAARLRFRRDLPGRERETYEVTLDPRSGYVLAGEALTKWQHHIPPAKSPRYSITFRTLRR
jgi:alkylated DNA repair protein (DNA oxidative demethylase)